MVKRHAVRSHTRKRGDTEYTVRAYFKGNKARVSMSDEIEEWWNSISDVFDRNLITAKGNQNKRNKKVKIVQTSLDDLL